MTEKEFLVISSIVKAAYPNSNLMVSKEAMNLWYEMLKDLDFRKAQIGITEYISNNKFAPTIADIREKCTNISMIPIKDWGEAWGNVLIAIRRFGYMEEIKALESLDDITRKSTQRIGFQNICTSENITADRANFRMIYETIASRQKSENQMPLSLRTQKQELLEGLIKSTVAEIEKHEEPKKRLTDEERADTRKTSELIRKFKEEKGC